MSFELLSLSAAHAITPWSGILDPSRAIDWSSAGAIGGNPLTGALPDASWPLCTSAQAGTTVPIPPSASAATINSALAACASANPSGSIVMLSSGSFSLSSGIDFTGLSYVVLRGQGANSTSLAFSGGVFCNTSGGAFVCVSAFNNAPEFEGNVCDVAASSNLGQGSTAITLTNCGTTTPAVGSLSNLKVGSVMVLDQVDLYADPGTLWPSTCGPESTYETCNFSQEEQNGSFNRKDGPSVNGVLDRSLEQTVVVTAVNPATGEVSFTPGLYAPNWTSVQLPQAWYPTVTQTNVGLENLLIQPQSPSVYVVDQNVIMGSCYSCWVSGVASLYAARSHILTGWSDHVTIQNNYIYGSQTSGSQSYGFENRFGCDTLYLNNIAQQITDSAPQLNTVGSVAAYNLGIETVYGNGYFQAAFYIHSGFDHFNLLEGNIGTGFIADDFHGTHAFETLYRNFLAGWQPNCNGSPCTGDALAVHLMAGSRYFNVIGNVLGTPGYHNNYQCSATSTSNCPYGNSSIYALGYTLGQGADDAAVNGYCTSPACTSNGSWDPQVASYLMRWGNWDSVNAATQWNASEVPSAVSPYGNAVPSSQSLPPSFYLSAKPAWWGSLPWPGIGPDVTGGSIGQCKNGNYNLVPSTSSSLCTGSGASFLSAAWAGHVNLNPALNCALNVMGMPPDGSGGALNFNAAACYGTGGSAPPPPGSLPQPQVSFGDVPINNAVSVANASAFNGYAIDWTFAPVSGSVSASSVRHAQVSTNGTIAASGANVQPLSTGLSLGTYQVTVAVVDGNNNTVASVSGQITFVSADLSIVRVYPNPWRSDKHTGKPVTFDQLPLNSTIKIFTVSGHKAKEFDNVIGSVTWDLTNDSGDKVASGIYVYLITDSQGDKVKGKVAVIK